MKAAAEVVVPQTGDPVRLPIERDALLRHTPRRCWRTNRPGRPCRASRTLHDLIGQPIAHAVARLWLKWDCRISH